MKLIEKLKLMLTDLHCENDCIVYLNIPYLLIKNEEEVILHKTIHHRSLHLTVLMF